VSRPRAVGRTRTTPPGVLAIVAVAGASIPLAFAITSQSAWVVLGGIVAIAATVFALLSPRALILTIFVAKPVIDMLWFAHVDLFGLSVNAQSLLSVVTLVMAIVLIATRPVPLPPRIFAPMMALVALNGWALAITPDLAYGVEYFVRIFCGMPLVFIVPAIIERLPPPHKLLQLYLGVISFVCLTVLLQPLGILPYSSFGGGFARATGFYYHPWEVARYMIVAVPFLLAMMDESRRVRMVECWPYAVLFFVTLGVVFFTYLKAAWIVVFIQIVIWLFLTGRRPAAAVTLIAAMLIVAFPLREFFMSTFSDLWHLGDPITRGQALSGRVYIWSEYWRGLQQVGLRELLFGQGYMPSGMAESGHTPHDDFLRILVMNGVVGLVAYVTLIIVALASLAQAVKRLAKLRGIEWRIGIAAQCTLIAYILMGATADPSAQPSMTLYLWLLVGLVLGYARVGVRCGDKSS